MCVRETDRQKETDGRTDRPPDRQTYRPTHTPEPTAEEDEKDAEINELEEINALEEKLFAELEGKFCANGPGSYATEFVQIIIIVIIEYLLLLLLFARNQSRSQLGRFHRTL